MVAEPPELLAFLRRRQVLVHEQRAARAAYAYGVDLRRTRWIAGSGAGQTLLRAVDRRWARLLGHLDQARCVPRDAALPQPLMRATLELARMLRAPLPTLRCSRQDATPWPMFVPLAPTQASAHLLVVDTRAWEQADEPTRAFLLASALGHLQCDHGVMFAAHLLAHVAGRGLALVRTASSLWSKVGFFSADRAGLLASNDLEAAQRALSWAQADVPDWWPVGPDLELRKRALADFDHASVVATLRAKRRTANGSHTPKSESLLDADGAAAQEADPSAGHASSQHELVTDPSSASLVEPPAELPTMSPGWSLARCDERLTRHLGLL